MARVEIVCCCFLFAFGMTATTITCTAGSSEAGGPFSTETCAYIGIGGGIATMAGFCMGLYCARTPMSREPPIIVDPLRSELIL